VRSYSASLPFPRRSVGGQLRRATLPRPIALMTAGLPADKTPSDARAQTGELPGPDSEKSERASPVFSHA
jgi:hypothetical protein